MVISENRIAYILRVIGVFIFVSTGLTGIILMVQTDSLWGGIPVIFSGFVSGMLFVGFSEVIKLLQKIYNQLAGPVETVTAAEKLSPEIAGEYSVSQSARNEITEFFNSKGQKVSDIKATSKEDFYLVVVDGDELMVELGGFKPIVRKK
ncbi:hypothetical protein [Jeotgalibacillus sp. R-1-5s-1]|uniref:hypothetical protein n=1 Tax=Jeotgalibacillus sp. R-1-5s-1 TaxID=2555897 RepID=UPI00106DBE24|nr:hypothetical protein [Jeotgalibacillus sp. R-1-5s-1]TFE01345.1 hypothetical protein E2491_03870 [Jeotgalibacillus sp. R-1-5s-1]